MHTPESIFSSFVIEYLGEIETEFENTLACLSGAQMGSNHEKTGGRKSRDTLPLTKFLNKKEKVCDTVFRAQTKRPKIKRPTGQNVPAI